MVTEQDAKVIGLHEMLEYINKAKNKKERIALIQEYSNSSVPFTDYIRCVFDDRVKFLLPEGAPPYKPADEDMCSSWSKEHLLLRELVQVENLPYAKIEQTKRENVFIGMLERLDPKESVIIAEMTSKRCPFPTIKKSLIEEAMPGLVMIP